MVPSMAERLASLQGTYGRWMEEMREGRRLAGIDATRGGVREKGAKETEDRKDLERGPRQVLETFVWKWSYINENTSIWALKEYSAANLYCNHNYKSLWEDLYRWPVIGNIILIIASFGLKGLCLLIFFYELWGLPYLDPSTAR